LRTPRRLCGLFTRLCGRFLKPREDLIRKILPGRLAVKIGEGCAAGIILAFCFFFITGNLLPYVRSRSLNLTLPGPAQSASVLNAYASPALLDEEPFAEVPAEGGLQSPAAPAGFGALSLREHRIRSGETLSAIAAAAALNLDTVISFNRIQDVRKLPAGTHLKLPNQNGLLYTVRRGDSLATIARAYAVSAEAIADVNDLESATIHPGQELFIPGARMRQFELKKILGELFVYPTAGRLSSSFGMRPDPFTRVRRFHNGIDLAGPPGTHVVAAMEGKVAKIGVHPTYGRYIIISHSGGYQTWYAHLQKALVEQGKTVAQGQLIGEMGNTGYSTGPHLHFSIFKDGSPVDPLKFLR
jgi:murein DD-endopeptidase MepM/ murein hydrolase activator NlpD